MAQTKIRLETPHGNRYLTRLCKHWSHRFVVSFDSNHGHIDFGGSSCELAVEENILYISVQCPQAELDELEAVVADHLQRIAARDQPLQLTWQRVCVDQHDAHLGNTTP